MKIRSIAYYIVLLLIFSCSKNDTANPVNDPMAVDILKEVNAFRADSIGMPALINSAAVEKQALAHSYDMATGGSFSHDGFSTRVNNIAASMAVSKSAENIAYGYATAKEVVRGWLDSPGHRANISGDYTYSGIGVVKSKDGTYYFTQLFILP